jgi:hypothetical protein
MYVAFAFANPTIPKHLVVYLCHRQINSIAAAAAAAAAAVTECL